MSHRDLNVERIGNEVLQIEFPGAGPTAVAAPGICENHDLSGIGISLETFRLPPLGNAIDRKLRRVVRTAHIETSSIGLQIVNAIRHDNSVGE